MKESITKYFQPGILQWMSYPDRGKLQSLRTICCDDFFNYLEVSGFDPDDLPAAASMIAQSHMNCSVCAAPAFLGQGLNPNSVVEEERKKAEDFLLSLIPQAQALGAGGIGFLAGKYEESRKEEAYQALLKTTFNVCEAAKACGLMVEVEVFDYDVDKCTLIGPAPLAARYAADVRAKYDNFGLLVDLSHIPIIHESIDYSVSTLKDYITHLHYGNAVMKPGCDAYGDRHPRMGFPNSENDVEQLVEFLRALRAAGLFRPEAPLPLSCEVKPWAGEDDDIVVANTKRCLTRAWALLEDED
ncbi:MAG: sugar phosphate isomerase/epimerase [Lachnospiraceae bacterium]|nr:sugar phosphate isomerase/epimerase [Lachnospiraceae bacterium]